ncbi:MAG TPA: hypothetical protein VGC97_10015 [Pyrinomonadaceae bacterium]|jgi:hypothetical protein
MKISKKIRVVRDAIKGDLTGATGRRIRAQSVAALFNGIKSTDWQTYMENFHSNICQLDRLLGKDQAWLNDNTNDWSGADILAYIVGGGPCGGGTELSMADNMTFKQKQFLDKDCPERFVEGEADPLPEELRPFAHDARWEETLREEEPDPVEVQ